jgi:hypothetical protein
VVTTKSAEVLNRALRKLLAWLAVSLKADLPAFKGKTPLVMSCEEYY